MPSVNVEGVEVWYEVQGEGTPLVLIAPPVVGNTVFYHQIEELSPHCKIITFDLRGHGQSGFSGAPLTYTVIADDVCHIMNQLQIEKAVILGYSMGGTAALEFMKRYPNRTLGGILVGGFSEAIGVGLRLEMALAVRVASMRAMRTLACGLALANADALDAFQSTYRYGAQCHPNAVKSIFQQAISYNCTAELPHMTQSTLIVLGNQDRHVKRAIAIVKNGLPNCDMVRIPGGSHQLPTQSYRQLNREVRRFIAQQI